METAVTTGEIWIWGLTGKFGIMTEHVWGLKRKTWIWYVTILLSK
jgi:hypothetical protein